jgi:DNA-binding transcriptional ArsR family regulator
MRIRSVTYSRDAVFQALADPTRRAVLDLLRSGSQPAGQIARAFPISRPAISKHLLLLRRAHLVTGERRGRHRYYGLNAAPLASVDNWLSEYRRFWKSSLESLKTFVEAENKSKGPTSTSRATNTLANKQQIHRLDERPHNHRRIRP